MNNKSNILGIGPYIGSFEYEITAFRPYARWLYEMTNFKDVYVNTHYNRLFMYDFIKKENRIPINRVISNDEFKLKGYISKDFEVKDFNFFVRIFKDHIFNLTKVPKKNIDIEYINYTKKTKPIPIYKKMFEPILIPNIDISDRHRNKIIIIPHKYENIGRMQSIIENIDDSIIIGDWSSINFQEENVLSNIKDYRENIYKYIIKYISEAKAVVSPVSFWVLLCNLQKVPVFSWGRQVGQFKNDGVYHFNNKKSMSLVVDKDVSYKRIIDMFEYFKGEKL